MIAPIGGVAFKLVQRLESRVNLSDAQEAPLGDEVAYRTDLKQITLVS